LPSGKPKSVRKPDPNRTHRAVMTLAMLRAKRAVEANIRAQGLRPVDFSAREITERAEAYLAQHMEALSAEALELIATWPGFARWRCAELSSDAQKQSEPKSTASTLQISGAK
jgi:hypothetical protein